MKRKKNNDDCQNQILELLLKHGKQERDAEEEGKKIKSRQIQMTKKNSERKMEFFFLELKKAPPTTAQFHHIKESCVCVCIK